MKELKILKVLLIAAIFIGSFAAADAQKKTSKVPKDVMGIGVALGSVGNLGGQFTYAIQENLHLGAYVGLKFDTGADNEDSKTEIYFAPTAKWFFMEPIRNLRPFAMFQFEVSSQTVSEYDPIDQNLTTSHMESTTGLAASIGGEWFPYSSVGVYGGVRVLDFQFDPSKVIAGIAGGFIGIEWFLN